MFRLSVLLAPLAGPYPMRKVLFWLHLIAGTVTGLIILLMSVTGVLLTYQRQIIAWADREFHSSSPSPGAERLPIDALLVRLRQSEGAMPGTITLRSSPAAALEASFGRERIVYVDRYSGTVLGEGSKRIRSFFHGVTDWHRWLAVEGPGRVTARAITGACNLAFLFLVVSGFFLWWPKKLTWQHVKPIILFRGQLSGKARNWNWHNVIGFWSAVPLFFVVISATVISYPWASDLVYRAMGNEPPSRPPAGGPGSPPLREAGARGGQGDPLQGLERLLVRAEQQVEGWQSISLRPPDRVGTPVAFTIDQGNGGQPQKRATLTLNGRTGEVVRWEPFSSFNKGRRVRTWMRWIHTGEAGGWVGQTIAGVASAGGAMLVWTGLALAWQRLRAWQARRGAREAALIGR